MFSDNNRISVKQLGKMMVFDMFSISTLLIPSITVSVAGRDGILSIILGTFFALLYGAVILMFCNNIKGDIIEYSNHTVGKFITVIFSLCYIVKILVSLLFSISLFGQIIRDTLLMDTSFKVIIGTLLFVGAYASFGGIEVRARITEVLFCVILVPIFLLFLLGLKNIDVANLTPIFVNYGSGIMAGGYFVLLMYSSIELLIFAVPMIKNYEKSKCFLQIKKSIGIVGVLNILVFLVTVGTLGVVGTNKKFWSTITVMQTIKMPGGFIQRQDGIMIALWILSIFIIISTFIYYLSYITSKITRRNKYQVFVFPFAILAFFLGSMEMDMTALLSYYGNYMAYIGLPQSILIPAIVVIVGTIRKNKKGA